MATHTTHKEIAPSSKKASPSLAVPKAEIKQPSLSAALASQKLHAQLGDKTLEFDEHDILGDGNCGFTSLGTTREEVSSLLLSLADDEKARIELADEVQGLLRENRESKLHTEKTQKLFAELDTAQVALDEQVRQLNNQLATEAKTTETKTIPSAVFQRQNLEGLIERLKESSHPPHQTTLTTLRTARLQIFQIREKIKLCCQSREVFERYIVEGLARTEWLGYRSAKLFAKLKQYNLYVFRPVVGKSGWLELAEQQECAAPENTFYLLHTNRFTHYNLLSIVQTPISDSTPDFKNTSTSQKNALSNELKTNARAPASDSADRKISEISKKVPALKINFEELQKTVQRITHPPTQALLSETVAAVQKRVIAFEEDRVDPIFSSSAYQHALKTLSDLEDLLVADQENIKGADTISKRRADGIFVCLKEAIDVVKKEITPTVTSVTTLPEPLGQNHRLRFDQQLLLRDPLHTKLKEMLKNVAKIGRDHHLPKSVFICYAWPRLEREQEKHLAWVQPFLKGLRQHLHQAGLTTVKLDIEDGPPGGNIETYMKGALTADFVLLIGTESLLFKHEGSGVSAVCTELVHIRRKREADSKAGKHRVFPLLISGNYPEAFPAEYDRYNTVKDWKTGPQTYFEHLCWLIPALYSTDKEAFENIWAAFLQTLTEDEKVLVTQGLTQEGVLLQLAAEQQQKKAADQKRELVSHSFLELQSSGERKEAKRLLPAFTFEQAQKEKEKIRDITSYDLLDQQHQVEPSRSWVEKVKCGTQEFFRTSDAVTYGLPKRILGFIGRAELLNKLTIQFSRSETSVEKEAKETKKIQASAIEPQKVVLCGIGGIGKTRLALEYAHRTAKAYTHIIWFAAEKPDILMSSYRLFAKEKNLSGKRYLSNDDVIKSVNQWLLLNPNWLIIYDNVESYDDIKDYLPAEGTGDILLTSRLAPKRWYQPFIPLAVEVLSPEEAQRLIVALTDLRTDTDPDIPKLANLLGYLPLALTHASAYIRENTMPVAGYLKEYEKKAKYLLEQADSPPDFLQHDAVFVTWNISLDAIAREEKNKGKTVQAKQLLQFCAYLSPQKISSRLIEIWHQHTYPATQELFREARGRLHAYSLIQLDPSDESIQVHRLVQQVMREQLTPTEQHAQIGHVLACFSSANPEKVVKQPDRHLWRALLPHLETIITHHDENRRVEDELFKLALGHLGYIYVRQLHYGQQALRYVERAAKQHEYPPAYLMLHILYAGDRGVTKNPTLQAQCGEALKKNITWFQERAEKGETYAQYCLGDCYFYGVGVEKKWSEAVLWWQRAAEQGDAVAQNALGVCYSYGAGTPKDEKQAHFWIQRAAEQELPLAQHNLGCDYESGTGSVAQDYAQAVIWFRRAAQQGLPRALDKLGDCYLTGQGVEEDLTQAEQYYRQAAAHGNIHSLVMLIVLCADKKDYAEAFRWGNIAVALGDAQIQNLMGDYYRTGQWVEKNLAQAEQYYRQAAAHGNIDSLLMLSAICADKKDYPEAFRWGDIAVKLGDAQAQNLMGDIYAEAEPDCKKAIGFYIQAAKQNYKYAQFELGNCYENGRGVAKDEAQAVIWYQKAADQGHVDAKINLAILLDPPQIQYKLFQHYYQQENLLAAIDHAEIALQLAKKANWNKENPEQLESVLHNLAFYYQCRAQEYLLASDTQAAKGANEQAGQYFENALLVKSDAGTHTVYANYLLHQQKISEAIEHLEAALKLNPNPAYALNYNKIGRPTLDADLQKEIDEWGLVKFKTLILTRYLLVTTYIQQNNQELATSVLIAFQTAADQANDPLTYSVLGHAYRAIGNDEAAMDCYSHALKLKPDYKLAQQRIEEYKRGRSSAADDKNAASPDAESTQHPPAKSLFLETKETKKSASGLSQFFAPASSQESKNTLPENYQEVDVPDDNNCLFWATSLAILLPTLNDESAFNTAYARLFGTTGSLVLESKRTQETINIDDTATKEGVRAMLRTYDCQKETPHQFQGDSLKKLVCDIFRNRVVDYMTQQLDEATQKSIYIEAGRADWNNYAAAMRQPTGWGGEPEIRAISQLAQVHIKVLGSGYTRDYLATGATTTLYIVHASAGKGTRDSKNHYHFGLAETVYRAHKQPAVSSEPLKSKL